MDAIVFIACLTARSLREVIARRVREGEKVDAFWTSTYESWGRTIDHLNDRIHDAIIRGEMHDNDADLIGTTAYLHMKDFDHDVQDRIFGRWPWKDAGGKMLSWTQFRKLKPEDRYSVE
jgi:hypothetical protein